MREELMLIVTEPLRQPNSDGDAFFEALEATLDTLCYLITEGWLTAAEKVELPDLSEQPHYDVTDRAEMARSIGADLPERVERWAAAHGRSGDYGLGTDEQGMWELFRNGRISLDELGPERRRRLLGPDDGQ
jgi:hypothetical protein